jgi:hypothetical protein
MDHELDRFAVVRAHEKMTLIGNVMYVQNNTTLFTGL